MSTPSFDPKTSFSLFPPTIQNIFQILHQNYPFNPDFKDTSSEEILKPFNKESGKKDYSKKDDNDDYEKNSSLILDFFILNIPKIIYHLYEQNKKSKWIPASTILTATIAKFMINRSKRIVPAGEYLDEKESLPFIVSERLYAKMQWYEWLLIQLQTAAATFENERAKSLFASFIPKTLETINERLVAYALFNNRAHPDPKDLYQPIIIQNKPTAKTDLSTKTTEVSIKKDTVSQIKEQKNSDETPNLPTIKMTSPEESLNMSLKQETPLITETKKSNNPDTEKLTLLFKQIYVGLRIGQAGFFKTNFLKDKENLSATELEDAIIKRFLAKPNGRTAQAWVLANKYIGRYDQLALYKDIRLWSFEHSTLPTRSTLNKYSIFSSSSLKISLEKLTVETLSQHAQGKTNCSADICKAINFNFKPSS